MKEIAVFGEFDSDNIGDVLIGKGQQLVYKANKKDFITVSLELNKRTHSSTAEQVKANPIILILKKVHRLFYKKNYLYRHILEVSLYLTSKHAYISHGEQSLTFGETIVIGGGQLFNDNTLRMLLRIFSLVSIAKSKKRRVLVIGSGVTTPKTFISNYLLSKIFSQIENKDIYLRDMKSIQVVNSLIDTSLDSSNHIPDFAIPYISSAYKKNKQIVNRVGLDPILIG